MRWRADVPGAVWRELQLPARDGTPGRDREATTMTKVPKKIQTYVDAADDVALLEAQAVDDPTKLESPRFAQHLEEARREARVAFQETNRGPAPPRRARRSARLT